MSNKPRKKKNSNMKRLTMVSKFVLKDVAIVFTLGEKANFVNMKSKDLIATSRDIITAANDVQHDWKVYISVMLETSLGEKYIKINECAAMRRCLQTDMLDALHIEHEKLINSTKRADRVNVGWVAVPSGKDLTEKEVESLLCCLPCWGVYDRGSISTNKDNLKDSENQIKALEALC